MHNHDIGSSVYSHTSPNILPLSVLTIMFDLEYRRITLDKLFRGLYVPMYMMNKMLNAWPIGLTLTTKS